jgi:hypothetical protein
MCRKKEGEKMENEKIEQKLVEVLKELDELKAKVQWLETWVEAIGERVEILTQNTDDLKRQVPYDYEAEARRMRRMYGEDYDE